MSGFIYFSFISQQSLILNYFFLTDGSFVVYQNIRMYSYFLQSLTVTLLISVMGILGSIMSGKMG